MTVELDDRLRELFADDRLDLPAPPDTAEAIVAGARRRRRTRTAVAAAFSLTVLVAGGAAVSGIGRLVSEPAAPSRSTVVETVTVSVAASKPAEPGGYGGMALGMTRQDLRDANTVLYPVRMETCDYYSTGVVAGEAVVVSPRHGVVRITLPALGVTPSGVGAGSSTAEVLTRYPTAVWRRGDLLTVPMPGTPAWQYVLRLDAAGRVTSVRMESIGHDCDLGDE
ncbi:hypothetical protein ACRAKI_00465 [Saccharothrix isguenensis]